MIACMAHNFLFNVFIILLRIIHYIGLYWQKYKYLLDVWKRKIKKWLKWFWHRVVLKYWRRFVRWMDKRFKRLMKFLRWVKIQLFFLWRRIIFWKLQVYQWWTRFMNWINNIDKEPTIPKT